MIYRKVIDVRTGVVVYISERKIKLPDRSCYVLNTHGRIHSIPDEDIKYYVKEEKYTKMAKVLYGKK